MPEAPPETLSISTITCPSCGARTAAEMPTEACQFFWPCPSCGTLLRPEKGDCCVFCSYGDVPCPPIQSEQAGGDSQAGGETASCCAP
jgi:hypothetical protein